jgi:hypothetical protein
MLFTAAGPFQCLQVRGEGAAQQPEAAAQGTVTGCDHQLDCSRLTDLQHMNFIGISKFRALF